MTDGSQQDENSADTSDGEPALDATPAPTPDATSDEKTSPAAASPSGSAAVPLRSLTPRFEEQHHETYLDRLEEAIKDPRNHNIALTGRYGAGKSSVLDEFEANHRKATQRLAISTLAPGEAGETTTNRIQKEIVKQLLYGASRKVGKNSRFSRIAVLTWRKALVQAVGIVGCVGALLYLFGWLPDIKWTGSGEDTWVRVVAWCGTAALVALVVAGVRVVLDGRFVSDVSAGGTGVTLSETPKTFFDKYLDEIVHYFDQESKDIVIFEDLERFEDPRIFEAVRELNILLNDTPRRRAKRRGNRPGRLLRWLLGKLPGDVPGWLTAKLPAKWATRVLGLGVPLRFVYAVKDSLFEKLGADTKELADAGEAAAAETLRANRTKFFDLVIPIVPFISHRNARELLSDLLAESAITGIERRLVNLVAQHSTDMRLLRNMCNEYLVFAERLLESEKTAPGLDPGKLFALVAYKNFHLKDFEDISRRDSDLDRLYQFHQKLVRGAIAEKEQRKLDLQAKRVKIRTREDTAQRVGQRLVRYADAERRQSNWKYLMFVVGSKIYPADMATSYKFWAAVADAGAITISVAPDAAGKQTNSLVNMDRTDLDLMVPEGLDGNRWVELDEEATRAELANIDQEVAALRRAGFLELAEMPAYTLSVPALAPAGTDAQDAGQQPSVRRTFAELIGHTLESQLARDLVLRGYLDRNFSLYAAQFYGHFSGADVANFMVHHVQTNTMNVDYDLSRDGAVANLLLEAEDAGEDFTNTVATYNVDVVNHLLHTGHPRAADVVDHLVTDYDDDARTFLTAYLTFGAQREELVARLAAQPWRGVFEHLATSTDVPSDVRPALVGVALAAADAEAGYELPESFGQFLAESYKEMPAFTQPLPETAIDTVVTMLERAGVLIPELSTLDAALLARIVEHNRYRLTAANLRDALGVAGAASLDTCLADETVYDYCLANPGEYLAAVNQDAETEYALLSPETLVRALNDATGRWDVDQLEEHLPGLIGATRSPEARLTSLNAVPPSTWPELAGAHLFEATLANVERYRAEVGDIDADLAGLLESAGSIAVVNDDDVDKRFDRDAAAIAVLNASTFSSTEVRVALALSLDPTRPLSATVFVVESSDLFARLLTAGLVADDAESFTRFHDGGWAAIGPAIAASADIANFVDPDLVSGMVAKVFADPSSREKIGEKIASNAETFVTDADGPALQAVAQYADEHNMSLRPETLVRIATAQSAERARALRLLDRALPAASAAQIVETFTTFGGEYGKVGRSGAKFNVDYDELHERLLTILREAGTIEEFKKKYGRDLYVVKVA